MHRTQSNFLNSSFDFKADEQILKFRYSLFNSSITFIATVLFIFSVYRFSIREYTVGLIDLLYSLVLVWSVWKLRKRKDLYFSIAYFVISLTFIALAVSTVAAKEINILNWYVLFVFIAFIMGGVKSGFAAYLASSITLFLVSQFFPETYTIKSVITLISINSLLTFMVYQYDKRVNFDYLRLEEINKLELQREHETLRILGKLSEYKDPETGDHINRVSEYSHLLADASGLSDDDIDTIFFAAPFHDIGKVGIADSILLKNGKLDSNEFEVVKTHTSIGSEILMNTNSKYLRAGAIIAATHHEKWDGSEYPNGLSGESIPIMGRIVAIADVFDALTSVRPYKEAWSFDKAMAYVIKQSDSHFDPTLTQLFKENEQHVFEIFKKHTDTVGD